ncbi:MAG: helix-turn-helix transcriptional regulator [Clostridia bacterium]|nr:helix-turn-helix transcriptional regulator [Clostridia bacterium]
MKSNTKYSIVNDIINYLNFLKQLGYGVSLCNLDKVFRGCYEQLLLYSGHNYERCIRIKEHNKQSCLKHQDQLLERVSEDFCGPFTCFAGVTEFVFPIEHDKNRYGIICLNPKKNTDKNTAKSIIIPLSYMFEKLLDKLLSENACGNQVNTGQKTYYQVIDFIADNVDRPITLKDICEYTHYSQSYISREFKKINGKSVIDYAIDFKMKTAMQFLEKTDLSVSDVAFKVGYYNPNDFTYTFKKRVGQSPRAYRAKFNKLKA